MTTSFVCILGFTGCTNDDAMPSGDQDGTDQGDTDTDTDTGTEPTYDLHRGGRLYDSWYGDLSFTGSFTPDDPETPEADGIGGPNGDGTLNSGDGTPMLNTGHDYRLKNLFGWDLRGAEGVYGPTYQNKSYVLDINLLAADMDRAALTQMLTDGTSSIPAYGEVLADGQIADIVESVFQTREGNLPQPSDVWELSPEAANGYVLNSGADVENGHMLIASSCAIMGCHGADGTEQLFDDGELSLGLMGRTKSYEAWFKVLHGQPGTAMEAQVPDASAQEQAAFIRDVLAALCDRTAYPQGEATAEEVADGDPRCGEYLQ